jgi:hypothetical protein
MIPVMRLYERQGTPSTEIARSRSSLSRGSVRVGRVPRDAHPDAHTVVSFLCDVGEKYVIDYKRHPVVYQQGCGAMAECDASRSTTGSQCVA